MRLIAGSLLMLSLGATATFAQSYQAPPPFNHIVVIVQENRTPDNLFGAASTQSVCGGEDPFEPGIDIDNGGPNEVTGGLTCNSVLHLSMDGFDPDHTHKPDTAILITWDDWGGWFR